MFDFELPEAALSDEEAEPCLLDLGHWGMCMEFAEDISMADKAGPVVSEAEIRSVFARGKRGLSSCSTAFGDGDLESCASPDFGWES